MSYNTSHYSCGIGNNIDFPTDFEPVQEDTAKYSDSRALVDCEEYCRRELPRTVRVALENVVRPESQSILNDINGQLMKVIGDCLDQVFTRYRASVTLNSAALRTAPLTKEMQKQLMWNRSDAISKLDLNFSSGTEMMSEKGSSMLELPTFSQPHPQQAHVATIMEQPESKFTISMLHSDLPASDNSNQSPAAPHMACSAFSILNHHSCLIPQSQTTRSQLSLSCDTEVDISQQPIGSTSKAAESDITGFVTTESEGPWISIMDHELPDDFDWTNSWNFEPPEVPDQGRSQSL